MQCASFSRRNWGPAHIFLEEMFTKTRKTQKNAYYEHLWLYIGPPEHIWPGVQKECQGVNVTLGSPQTLMKRDLMANCPSWVAPWLEEWGTFTSAPRVPQGERTLVAYGSN